MYGHRTLAMMLFSLKGETCFFFFVFLKNHFENGFGVATYFILFLRENKIRKKTLNVTLNMKIKSGTTEYRFEG